MPAEQSLQLTLGLLYHLGLFLAELLTLCPCVAAGTTRAEAPMRGEAIRRLRAEAVQL